MKFSWLGNLTWRCSFLWVFKVANKNKSNEHVFQKREWNNTSQSNSLRIHNASNSKLDIPFLNCFVEISNRGHFAHGPAIVVIAIIICIIISSSMINPHSAKLEIYPSFINWTKRSKKLFWIILLKSASLGTLLTVPPYLLLLLPFFLLLLLLLLLLLWLWFWDFFTWRNTLQITKNNFNEIFSFTTA